QPGMVGDAGQHLGADFCAFVKCPNEILVSRTLQCNVGRTLDSFGNPADAKEGSIYAIGFRTGPLAHTEAKLMVLCPTFSISMRSAITRSARASTAASASPLVAP